MENFIEKLKGVDKKVWIGVGIGAAVIIILIIALVIGLGGKKPTGGNNSQNGTQAGTQTEGSATELLGTEDVTETIGTEMGTEIETEMGTETTESESQTEGIGGTTVTQNPDVNGVTQQPTTTKPDGQEILGVGTASNPYFETPNLDNMTLTTVSIPAGQVLYYNIYRVGGMYLTINDSDAYVITSSGKRYDASNGKVSFKVENAMSNEYVSFQIGNKSGTSKAFTIKFSNPTGSQVNPTKIDNITTAGNSFNVSLATGNSAGHYYKYTAQSTGQIKLYISSFSSKTSGSEGMITVNVIKGDVPTQYNFETSEHVFTDESGRKYILIDVEAGNTVEIIISAKPVSNKYPAADITWVAQYI